MLFIGTLTEISQEAVGKLLGRANKGSYRNKTHGGHPHQNHSIGMVGPVEFLLLLSNCAIILATCVIRLNF